MNGNKKVVAFVLGFTISLTAAPFLSRLQVRSLVHAGHVANTTASGPVEQEQEEAMPQPEKRAIKGAASRRTATVAYMTPNRIVDLNTDTGNVALPEVMQELHSLKKDKKKKVRIAWLGDSMIEGDLLTQTFRKRIQKMFGGQGVGFVPVKSVSAANRATVRATPDGNWEEETFKTKSCRSPLFFSGHTFFTSGGSVAMTDETVADSGQTLVKALLCGPAHGEVSLRVNGRDGHYQATAAFNRLLLDSSSSRNISVEIANDKLPVYGISLEPTAGVVVDNFSFRGSSGVELKVLDTALLGELDQQGYYDLVVLQYGVNVLWKPEIVNYDYYEKMMRKTLVTLRRAMPHTNFLIIGTADRAFMYDGAWKTAIGIDSLLAVQASLAAEYNMAFYNLYESMGGNGTIVKWTEAEQPLANHDYVHPNHRGAEKLGNMIFDDFIRDYYRTDSGLMKKEYTAYNK